MKRALAGALLGATLWLCACSPPPATFASPAQGGPAWTKLTTAHFTLYTDARADNARTIAALLEELYVTLEDVGFPPPKSAPGRIDVTFLQDVDMFRQVAPRSYLRQYAGPASHDPERKPMVVFSGSSAPLDRYVNTPLSESLRRLLVRRLVALHLPTAPAWLDEGLALFHERLAVTYDSDVVRVGSAPRSFPFRRGPTTVLGDGMNRDRGVRASRDEVPGPAALLALDGDFLRVDDRDLASVKSRVLFRTASWNLVRTMLLGPPPFKASFARYVDDLRKGAEPRAAWAAALRANGISAERLEAEYKKTLERWPGDYENVAYRLRPPVVPEQTPMTEAEVHLLWARIRPWQDAHLPRVGAELDAAIKADPNLAPAYVLRGEWRAATRRPHADILADLRRAVALAPGDPHAASALARYLDHYRRQNPAAKAEVEGELRTLIEGLRQSANSAPTWDFLATYEARESRPEPALAFARKAVAADPTCFECYDTLALLLHGLGRLEEAVAAERVGVRLTPDNVNNADMLKRLRTFASEIAAGTAPSPAAPPPASPAGSPPASPDAPPPAGHDATTAAASDRGHAPGAGASR